MTERRRTHVRRVVDLLDAWAKSLDVAGDEHARWRRAAWLHDALKDAPRRDLESLVDDEFAGFAPAVWHGPAAARRAEAEGEDDADVLSAVRYHTVGNVEWGRTGRMLYLADFLDPGRPIDLPPRERWIAQVGQGAADVGDVMAAVVRDRVGRGLRSGKPMHPRTRAWLDAFTR